MLKFQEEYSIAYQSFEDFILVIFVLVDDLYKKVASENAWYSLVKKDVRHLFPRMCERSQFNRTRRNLSVVIDQIYASKKQTYFGYKVHVLTTFNGAIKAFEVTDANVDDHCALYDLSPVVKSGSVIVGDKGYISKPLENALKDQGKILLVLKRSNALEPHSEDLQRLIFKQFSCF